MEWQPIETAPKDKRILVFTPEYPEEHPMRYRVVSGDLARTLSDATHWHPLTSPNTGTAG